MLFSKTSLLVYFYHTSVNKFPSNIVRLTIKTSQSLSGGNNLQGTEDKAPPPHPPSPDWFCHDVQDGGSMIEHGFLMHMIKSLKKGCPQSNLYTPLEDL